MANRQFNQTIQSDIRPLQSDIKFLFLIPIHPTDLHQVRLPGFSVNQFKVLIGSFFLWLVIKVRVHSDNRNKQRASAASERNGYLGVGGTVSCHQPNGVASYWLTSVTQATISAAFIRGLIQYGTMLQHIQRKIEMHGATGFCTMEERKAKERLKKKSSLLLYNHISRALPNIPWKLGAFLQAPFVQR